MTRSEPSAETPLPRAGGEAIARAGEVARAGAGAGAPDWAALGAILVGMASFGLSLGLAYPLLSLLLAERGVAPGAIGFNAAVMGFGVLASTLALPALCRRFSTGLILTASLLGMAVLLLAFAATGDLTLWLLLRIALGFCNNNVFVLCEAWLNVAVPERLRGRAAAAFGMAVSGGFALGPLGVPLFGLEGALPFAACAALLGLMAILLALASRRARVTPEAPSLGAMLGFLRGGGLLLLALVAAFGFLDWAGLSVMPAYFLAKGLSAEGAALTVTVIHVGMLLCAPLVGFALDRWRRLGVALGCALASAAALALLPLLPGGGWLFWSLLLLVGGTSAGLYTAALTLLGERWRGGGLAAGSAVFSLTYTAAGTLGMLGAGGVMELFGREAAPLLFAAAFALAGLLALGALLRPGRRGG